MVAEQERHFNAVSTLFRRCFNAVSTLFRRCFGTFLMLFLMPFQDRHAAQQREAPNSHLMLLLTPYVLP
jgi:hypothetical protein